MAGKKLKVARKQLNLTQEKMSEKLDTPLRTYQGWERNAVKVPGIAIVAANLLIDKYLGKQGN